jgi:hypothetical protein
MHLLGSFTVWPHYHQVEVRAADADVADDCPQWERGDEPVVASDRCIVLATRPDLDGQEATKVTIEVWAGPLDGEQPGGTLVFDGKLLITEAGVVVGSSITDALHHVSVPAGRHRVRVHAEPPVEPDRLVVVFDSDPAVMGRSDTE